MDNESYVILVASIFCIMLGFLGTVLADVESISFKSCCYFVGVAFGFVIACQIVTPVVSENNYKKGQIDALTGKVNYKLRALPDSTTCWMKINPDSITPKK